jgi:hypothetical protein
MRSQISLGQWAGIRLVRNIFARNGVGVGIHLQDGFASVFGYIARGRSQFDVQSSLSHNCNLSYLIVKSKLI